MKLNRNLLEATNFGSIIFLIVAYITVFIISITPNIDCEQRRWGSIIILSVPVVLYLIMTMINLITSNFKIKMV